MSDDQRWDGVTERRGVQLHIVQYIDSRLAKHEVQVQAMLDRHTVEEAAKFAELMLRIDRNNDASAERHSTLVDKIASYLNKTESIESAFLRTDNGKLDALGHLYDHKTRKSSGEWWLKARGDLIKETMKWAALLALGWLISDLWIHAKHDASAAPVPALAASGARQ